MNISAKVTKHEENLIFAFFLTFPQGKISRNLYLALPCKFCMISVQNVADPAKDEISGKSSVTRTFHLIY